MPRKPHAGTVARRFQISKRARTAARFLGLAVRPIFCQGRRHQELVGSCVLVRLGSCHFLFTAAHVLDERKDHALFVGDQDGLIGLDGDITTTTLPAGGREGDKADVGIVRLSDDFVGELTNYQPLLHTNINIDERSIGGPPASQYLVMGYPASRARRRGAHVIGTGTFLFTSASQPRHVYDAFGVLPETHLVVQFDQKRSLTPSGQINAPKPKGVSGGAMWAFAPRIDAHPSEGKLVAIAIEDHRHPHKVIIGTRVPFYTEAIRAKYPECGHLPTPRRLRINATID